MTYILVAILSYTIGSIPFSYLVPRWLGKIDIRKHGSGNAGATNVFRTLGLKVGFWAFLGDFLKGLVPTLIAHQILGINYAVLAAAFAVLGHCYSVWLNFKGGKGIATSAGAILILLPEAFLILLVLQFALIFIVKYMSVASISSASSLPIIAYLFDKPTEVFLFSAGLGAFVIFKHKDNIKRLIQGKENKLVFKKK